MSLLSGDDAAGITWLATPPDPLCLGAGGFTGDRDMSKPTKISKEQPPDLLPQLQSKLASWTVAQASLLFFSPSVPTAWLLPFLSVL